jgi:hypothetical protein
MKLSTAAEAAFARHETFHPRYGWMKKAVDGALLDPRLFTKEEAVVDLGVGKNMVRAIKHWGLATKVLEPLADSSHPRLPGVQVTDFGMRLLGPQGWDPYSEDAATNWLLHWKLLSPRSLVPVWWVALNEFPAVQFTIDDLRTFTHDFLSGVSEWDEPHPSSVTKDVDCFVKMYSVAEAGARATSDELVDSPFRELGLMRATDKRRTFRFNVGAKPTLPAPVTLYACLDFLAATGRPRADTRGDRVPGGGPASRTRTGTGRARGSGANRAPTHAAEPAARGRSLRRVPGVRGRGRSRHHIHRRRGGVPRYRATTARVHAGSSARAGPEALGR